mgnify:CR=1 FL=1
MDIIDPYLLEDDEASIDSPIAKNKTTSFSSADKDVSRKRSRKSTAATTSNAKQRTTKNQKQSIPAQETTKEKNSATHTMWNDSFGDL